MVKSVFLFSAIPQIDSLNSGEDSVEIKSKWQVGFRLDYNSVMETAMLKYDIQPDYVKRFHTYREYIFSPFGFYFPFRYNYNTDLKFEMRAGIVMNGDLLTSVLICFNIYYYPFNEKFYFVSGFEISKPSKVMEVIEQQPKYLSNPRVMRTLYREKKYYKILLGLGYQFTRKASIDFSILKPTEEKYGQYVINAEPGLYKLPNGKYDLELHWMLKLGINLYL